MKEINVTSLSFSNSKHTNRTCDGEWRKEIMEKTMQTYTYVSKGNFALREKPRPVLMHERDAIVKVTLASICSSDLHIKHGSIRLHLRVEIQVHFFQTVDLMVYLQVMSL